mmetsp:Transcript_19048/g.32617  ORF Transcript_19048/g.32617 Transcript_19048/m.32617 type:complete len:128 (-) Transcript_19048:2549-2932(-)
MHKDSRLHIIPGSLKTTRSSPKTLCTAGHLNLVMHVKAEQCRRSPGDVHTNSRLGHFTPGSLANAHHSTDNIAAKAKTMHTTVHNTHCSVATNVNVDELQRLIGALALDVTASLTHTHIYQPLSYLV